MRAWTTGLIAGIVGLVALACGGGGGGTDAALTDLPAADVSEVGPDAAVDAVSDAAADEADAAVLPWVPDAPVPAELLFPELTSSEGIAVDDQGRFLLTANDALMRLAPGGTPEKLVDIPLAPDQTAVGYAGLAWHPSWGAVFAQTTGSRLFRWTEDLGLVQIGDPIGGGPNGVLFDAEGHCLVSLSVDNALVRLDTPEAEPVTLATGIPFANGLALSADGTVLYVASTSEGAVYQVPLAGEPPYAPTLLKKDALLASADGLLLSPDGWLLVAGWAKGRIVALSPDTLETRVVSDQPAADLKFVASLAFGPGGDLDPRCLFGTRLHMPGLVRVCP